MAINSIPVLRVRGASPAVARQADAVNTAVAPSLRALAATPIMGAPPPAWVQPPSLLNGWVNFGGTYVPARYMKDALGYVQVEAVLKNGTGGSLTAGSTAWKLPPGYLPAYVLSLPAETGGAYVNVRVLPTGEVQLNGTVTSGSSLAFCFSFLAEA